MIERARQTDSSDMVQVWRTMTAHDETQPWWEPHQLFMSEFCNNNKMLPLRFTVFNYRNNGAHKMYGYVETTTRGIEMIGNEPLIIKNEKGKKTGELIFNQF